ncbi:hypothetical protein D3C73_1509820 [compost metagenome]
MAAGENEALHAVALSSLQQIQGGVIVGFDGGTKSDAGTVGTGQVQYRIASGHGTLDEDRVGQVAHHF